ncbi:MAG TPA: alkaline phosphatase family protein [Candidatus Saccharimonadales bacterium]|nr:alkaline phosphatase family protein [Candidatus Saccharimonadales bacterium]
MRHRLLWSTMTIIILLAIGALIYLSTRSNFYQTQLPTGNTADQASTTLPDFDHVVIMVFENKGYSTILYNSQAPYFGKLAKQNSLATHYYANFHPSLPNYIAMTSGTNAGITSDCSPDKCPAKVKNIADEIESSGRSWKAYQEDMPAPCTTYNSGRYAVRHNPFVYYPNILNDTQRCQSHDVPYSQLALDLSRNQLPDYVFITPNLCHDMHDCSVKAGNDWLAHEAPKIIDSDAFKNSNSLLIVTFDEAEGSDQTNRIPTILIGHSVKKNFISDQTYSHYSLLHTIEAAWGLKPLTKNDADAPVMSDFFTTER